MTRSLTIDIMLSQLWDRIEDYRADIAIYNRIEQEARLLWDQYQEQA